MPTNYIKMFILSVAVVASISCESSNNDRYSMTAFGSESVYTVVVLDKQNGDISTLIFPMTGTLIRPQYQGRFPNYKEYIDQITSISKTSSNNSAANSTKETHFDLDKFEKELDEKSRRIK